MQCSSKSKPKKGMRSRVPWRVKLERPQERFLVPIPPKMAARLGEGTLLVPRPLDVDEQIRLTPEGRLVTTRQIRARLAEKFGATTTCPLTTGIFVRIAAEAAEEDRRAGREPVTPYWRVVGDKGELNPKFPGGVAAQARRLRAEGHIVVPARGRRPPAVRGRES